jgi:hypothetical protein
MKRFLLFVIVLVLALTACAPKAAVPAAGPVLKVGNGTISKTYTVDDLKALGAVQADFKGVTYVGVTLTALLQDAGIDPTNLTAVKAVASDGFSANYDASIYAAEDTIVAYATVDGALTADDGTFRMVIPAGEGKMNVRQLAEIAAIP